MDTHARGVCEKLDRPVVMRRAESARDDQQIVAEAVGERGLELRRIVTDNRDSRRLEPETKQRRGEERPVSIVPVAAHELRARCDDRYARAGCQPVAVTMITCGRSPGT